MNKEPRALAVEEIVRTVGGSPKYRHVCPCTVGRIATEEWSKRSQLRLSPKQALRQATKATRSRLHQVYAAYESGVDYERAYRSLADAYERAVPTAIESACRQVLSLHASTRERLPIIDQFYARVFSHTGPPRVLLDLACGLNPLSLPWMGLGAGAVYHAYDIDAQRIAFLERFFRLAGVQGEAHFQDILCERPTERADVALLMKSSACLERQKAHSTLELLDAIGVRFAVITFPVTSLGRRQKGMPTHYAHMLEEMLADRPWPVTRLDLATELAFIVDRTGIAP